MQDQITKYSSGQYFLVQLWYRIIIPISSMPLNGIELNIGLLLITEYFVILIVCSLFLLSLKVKLFCEKN